MLGGAREWNLVSELDVSGIRSLCSIRRSSIEAARAPWRGSAGLATVCVSMEQGPAYQADEVVELAVFKVLRHHSHVVDGIDSRRHNHRTVCPPHRILASCCCGCSPVCPAARWWACRRLLHGGGGVRSGRRRGSSIRQSRRASDCVDVGRIVSIHGQPAPVGGRAVRSSLKTAAGGLSVLRAWASENFNFEYCQVFPIQRSSSPVLYIIRRGSTWYTVYARRARVRS
jgi:hypothetical protein